MTPPATSNKVGFPLSAPTAAALGAEAARTDTTIGGLARGAVEAYGGLGPLLPLIDQHCKRWNADFSVFLREAAERELLRYAHRRFEAIADELMAKHGHNVSIVVDPRTGALHVDGEPLTEAAGMKVKGLVGNVLDSGRDVEKRQLLLVIDSETAPSGSKPASLVGEVDLDVLSEIGGWPVKARSLARRAVLSDENGLPLDPLNPTK